MPSSKLRRSLRAHGHKLSAIVQVGKGGVSDGLIKQVQQALGDHELIKLRVAGEGPEDRFGVAERLAALPGVNIVQIVGGVILVYKRHPLLPRYEGEQARPGAESEGVDAKERGGTAEKRSPTADKRGAKRDDKRGAKRDDQRGAKRDEKRGAKRERKPEKRGAKAENRATKPRRR